MLTSKIWLIMALFFLGAASAMANIAIDEDFDSGTIFKSWGGIEPSTQTTTVQGVNIRIDGAILDGVAYGGAGKPITYTDDPSAGAIVAIDATHKCYELKAGKTLQFGTMDAVTNVNGNIPYWGDGNGLMQAALAVGTAAISGANGSVVGKLQIAFDGLSLTSPANMKTQTYELRVDTANNEVDVYSINKNAVAVKVLDGLKGTNWATITSALFVRGLNTDPITQKWTATIGGAQKGPDADTIMCTAAAGDSARMSVFVNGNAPATQYGWDASNGDGRLATDGRNDGRIMGIKFTAGASNSLYIDNIFCASDRFANAPVAVPGPDDRTNVHSRMNPFTELVQGVPAGGPPVATAKTWDLY